MAGNLQTVALWTSDFNWYNYYLVGGRAQKDRDSLQEMKGNIQKENVDIPR